MSLQDSDTDTGAGAEAGAEGATEARARRMGWKPEAEWQGEPPKDGFRTAEEFVEHGTAELSILRERNKKLDTQLVERDKRLDEMSGTLAEFKEFASKSEERAYKRAKKDLQAKQRQAMADSARYGFYRWWA